jgi:CheY-like chemotaxis protein
MHLRRLLLVDDNPNDTEMALEALQEHKLANDVVALKDGAEALDWLYRRGAYSTRPEGNPAVILLDLKMPKVDGLEVLRQIKSDPALKVIPIVMMTSSREEQDLVKSGEAARLPRVHRRHPRPRCLLGRPQRAPASGRELSRRLGTAGAGRRGRK